MAEDEPNSSRISHVDHRVEKHILRVGDAFFCKLAYNDELQHGLMCTQTREGADAIVWNGAHESCVG
jgi:hypothetical protein